MWGTVALVLVVVSAVVYYWLHSQKRPHPKWPEQLRTSGNDGVRMGVCVLKLCEHGCMDAWCTWAAYFIIVCVCVCMCMCVSVCVYMCVCVCFTDIPATLLLSATEMARMVKRKQITSKELVELHIQQIQRVRHLARLADTRTSTHTYTTHTTTHTTNTHSYHKHADIPPYT